MVILPSSGQLRTPCPAGVIWFGLTATLYCDLRLERAASRLDSCDFFCAIIAWYVDSWDLVCASKSLWAFLVGGCFGVGKRLLLGGKGADMLVDGFSEVAERIDVFPGGGNTIRSEYK